ncbi:MAG: hypothetical protein ABI691_12930 [Ginsengibacter sp.]
MLTIETFDQADLQKIKTIPRSIKVTLLIFLLLCVPFSFLFGLLGLTKKGHGYWVTTISLLAVFTLLLMFVIIKDYFLYYRDKTTRQKYKGEITIIGKSKGKGEKIVFTDLPELKKFILYTKEIFDSIHVGDKLDIEISKFSKTILKLDKDKINLLNEN